MTTGKKYIVLNMVDKWYKDGVEVTESEMMDHFGFVYLIELSDGRRYIGRKQVLNFTFKQVNKYCSSNDIIKQNKALISKKKVLQYASSKRELTYLETKWLFVKNVLEDLRYQNGNILGKFYRGKLK